MQDLNIFQTVPVSLLLNFLLDIWSNFFDVQGSNDGPSFLIKRSWKSQQKLCLSFFLEIVCLYNGMLQNEMTFIFVFTKGECCRENFSSFGSKIVDLHKQKLWKAPLLKGNVLSKYTDPWATSLVQVFFTHFASAYQLPGFFCARQTLASNRLQIIIHRNCLP